LTLAIIDGVIVKVGNSSFSVPTGAVREFIRIEDKSKLIVEPGGKEFVMIRNVCYPLMRLSDFYNLPTKVTELEDGIIVILEHEDKVLCVFVDALIGEQEIVVKPLPKYIKQVRGVSGCTQLGDGSISLILDAASLIMQNI
ncbi:MAG: chemotaxis protein CheW, partial [Lachnospiraceae bacterium]|nr:chemotaxis protein CheW [Lachnospiraceae bacterium]